MIGAKDLAFPQHQSAGVFTSSAARSRLRALLLQGGVDTWADFYTPHSTRLFFKHNT